MPKFRVQGEPHYRPELGRVPVGEVVNLPAGEKPAPGWEPLNDDGTPKVQTKAADEAPPKKPKT